MSTNRELRVCSLAWAAVTALLVAGCGGSSPAKPPTDGAVGGASGGSGGIDGGPADGGGGDLATDAPSSGGGTDGGGAGGSAGSGDAGATGGSTGVGGTGAGGTGALGGTGGTLPGGLTMAVSATPNPVSPGGGLLYRIDLTNTSTNTPTGNFTMTAAIPRFVTVDSYPSNVTCGTCRFGSLLNWAVTSLAPGTSTVEYISATVDNSTTFPPPPAGTILTLDATAAVGGSTLMRSTAVVVGSRTMNVAINAVPNRVLPGSKLTYTVSFGNTGTTSVPVLLRVPLPPGTTFVSATRGGTLSAGMVQWDLGTVAAGLADRRQFSVTANSGLADGALLVAEAELRDSATQQTLARQSTTNLVARQTLLALTMTGTPDPVVPGAAIVYTIGIANLSTNTPTGVFGVAATIPQSVRVASYPSNVSCGSCRFGDVLRWTVPSLGPGESTVEHITVEVDNSIAEPAPPPGTLITTDLTAFVFGGVGVTATVMVADGAGLNLQVSGAPNRVAPSATLTYTVSFGNAGAASVPALMRAPIPVGTTFVSATGGGTLNDGAVEWDLGMVAAGFADRRQFVVTVDSATPNGTLLAADLELRNATTLRTLVRRSTKNLVAAQTLLSLAVTGAPDPVSPGGTVVYTVSIANRSTTTATGVFTIAATIPEHATVEDYPSNVTCGTCRFGSLLSWAVGSLGPGDSTVQRITILVDNSIAHPAPAPGTLLTTELTAFIFGGVGASATSMVADGKGLSLQASATPNRVAPQGTLTYTVSFGNAGTIGVPALLRIPLPVGTTFVSATGGGVANGGAVQWDLGTLAPGAADKRQFSVTVDAATGNGTLLIAEAELRNPTTQQTLVRKSTNNLVASQTLLALSLTATPDPVSAGGTIAYTISITNLSTNTATGAFLATATVPEHVTTTMYPSNVTCGGCRFGNVLSWGVASLAPGANTVEHITVVVDNSVLLPPPAAGTILTANVAAFVFGGIQANLETVVGTGP